MQHFAARGNRFACGNNHSRIRYGNADDGYNAAEYIIGNSIGEVVCGNIVSRTDAWHADGVRTYSEGGFQMFRMHQQSDKVVFISVETEQHSQAHIVYAGFHGAVHSFGVVSIFAFRSGGMQGFVVFFVISFLKQDIGTDAGIL